MKHIYKLLIDVLNPENNEEGEHFRKTKTLLYIFVALHLSKSYIKGNSSDTEIVTFISVNIDPENQVRIRYFVFYYITL